MLKFLADVNIEKILVDYLKQSGYDVLWVPDYNCRLSDSDLLDLANTENRVLITNDKDFGEIIFQQRRISTGIILLRIKGENVRKKRLALKKLLAYYEDKISNHFTVITDRKIRIRILEDIS